TCLSLFLLRCVLLRPLSSFPTRRSSDLSRAALIPVRSEHEMVDQQLAAPIEQIGKVFPPRRRIEHVILVDLHPRQGLPLSINLRSEEHTSELQSRENLVCRLLLEKKKTK